MIKFLNDIRNVEKPISNNRKIINTIAVLFLGIALGTFSKFLDFRQAELPSGLMAIDAALDVHNFLGRFAIWVLIALCISIYSNSAIRASINVFAFFIGMVASYYLYSNYIAGFFPRSYAVIWFALKYQHPYTKHILNNTAKISADSISASLLFPLAYQQAKDNNGETAVNPNQITA